MKKAILYGLLLSFFCIFNDTEANDKMSALNTKEQKIGPGAENSAESGNRNPDPDSAGLRGNHDLKA